MIKGLSYLGATLCALLVSSSLLAQSVLPIASGGTGATTAVAAIQNVGGAGTGTLYANALQTTPGSDDGIANSITQCASLAYTCSIVSPPVYALTELPAWSQMSLNGYGVGPQTSLTQQLGFWDTRGGSFNRTYIDPVTSYGAQGWGVAELVKANFTKGPISANQRYNWYNAQVVDVIQTQGGLNAQLSGLNGKTTLAAVNANLVSNSVGQRFAYYDDPYCFGPGDCVGHVNYVSGPAGFRDPGDEGTEIGTALATESINVYRGTIFGAAATGSSSLTITPTNAGANEVIAGTQGEGRWLIDTASGKVTSLTASAVTDGVQQLSSAYGYFSIVTAASGVSTSSAYGTLTSAVTVPSSAQTPGAESPLFSVTGTLVPGVACVADQTQQSNTVNGQGNFETINITVVSGGSITATFQRPHPVGAAIFQGGQCGNFAEILQDTFPSGSNWSNGETSGITAYPVRHPWPVLGSIDGTHLIVWTARAEGGGFWSTFSASTGSQVVKLYGGAEVYKVAGASNDTIDNQFTLAPNNVAWATSDPVEESHYPAQHVTGQTINVSSFGEHHGFGRNLFYASYVTGAENSDVGINVVNGAPLTNYNAFGLGGQWNLPVAAIYVQGPWSYALSINGGTALNAVIGLNESPLGQNVAQPIVQTLGQYSIPTGDNLSYLNQAWSFVTPSMTVNSVSTSSGGSTTYTGTFPGGASNYYNGINVIFSGDSAHPSNNGTFICSSSTATTLTCNNANAVADTYTGTAIQVGGEYQIAMGQYGSTMHPVVHINQYGIQMDQAYTHVLPHYGLASYNPGSQEYAGMGHSGGLTELDEYKPGFAYTGIGVFVSASPNSPNTPSNLDYSLGQQGLYLSQNKYIGWGPSSTNAGNPSASISPTLAWGYLGGGMQLMTSPPNAGSSDDGVFDIDCSVAGTCSSLTNGTNVLRMTNTNSGNTGHDVLRYNPTSGSWIWSAGATAGNGTGSFAVSFSGTSGLIALPANLQVAGAKASSGTKCLQIDASGNVTNTGSACGALSGTTVSLGGSSLTAGTCSSTNVTITGATTSMVATASPVTYPGAPYFWNAYVSSANTVTVNVCAPIAGTPTASNYNVRVIP